MLLAGIATDFYNYHDAVMGSHRAASSGQWQAYNVLGEIVAQIYMTDGFGEKGFESLAVSSGSHYMDGKVRNFSLGVNIIDDACTGVGIRYEGHDQIREAPVQALGITALLQYRKYGQQCFVVDSHMERSLAGTSMKGIPKGHLKFPYPCFYVALPDSSQLGNGHLLFGDSPAHGNQSGFHKIGGFFVLHDAETSSVRVLMTGRPNDKSIALWDVPTVYFSMILDRIDWENPDGISESLDLILADSKNYNADAGVFNLWSSPQFAYHRQMHDKCMRHCLRLLVNLMLYVNSKSPDLHRVSEAKTGREKSLRKKLRKSKRKRSINRLKRKAGSIIKPSLVYVGRSFEAYSQDVVRQGGDPLRGHFRKAHWHTYYVGPRKYSDGTKIPLHKQDTEVLWVGMVEINSDNPNKVPSRTYKVSAD